MGRLKSFNLAIWPCGFNRIHSKQNDAIIADIVEAQQNEWGEGERIVPL